MICTNGHPVTQGGRFCSTCGTPLPLASPTPLEPIVPETAGVPGPPLYPTAISNKPPEHLPPPPGYVTHVQSQSTNGFAIASMVLGILWIEWVGSILAVIFGAIALRQIRARPAGGYGMAVAGLVLGIIGICTLALIIVLAVVAGH
jgi:hypothetical protein